jgi:hypothetical protein
MLVRKATSMSPSERERIDDAPEPYQGASLVDILREQYDKEDDAVDRYKEDKLNGL